MEPIKSTERTNILWASLRFFTVVTWNSVAIKWDWSGGHGQALLDHGEEPPRVQHDEQLIGELADGVDQVDPARDHKSSLVVRPGERLDAVEVGGLDVGDLVHHHAERIADR